MFDLFTDRARRVVSYAVQAAEKIGSDSVGVLHLLLGLMHEDGSVAAVALKNCGVEKGPAYLLIMEKLAATATFSSVAIPFTQEAKAAITQAPTYAHSLGHPYAGTEHVLIALMKDSVNSPDVTGILDKFGTTSTKVFDEVLQLLGAPLETTRASALDMAAQLAALVKRIEALERKAGL